MALRAEAFHVVIVACSVKEPFSTVCCVLFALCLSFTARISRLLPIVGALLVTRCRTTAGLTARCGQLQWEGEDYLPVQKSYRFHEAETD